SDWKGHLQTLLFLKTLFLCAGFTQRITNPQACNRAGGFCHHICPFLFSVIGSCGFPLNCCRWRKVSSGLYKGDITV
uniref:Beta-defensin-like domain-containing protein n=1 Tax=Terrapene triunguis TaxID=2587831 RepID=A0A674JNI2_9SAUR